MKESSDLVLVFGLQTELTEQKQYSNFRHINMICTFSELKLFDYRPLP